MKLYQILGAIFYGLYLVVKFDNIKLSIMNDFLKEPISRRKALQIIGFAAASLASMPPLPEVSSPEVAEISKKSDVLIIDFDQQSLMSQQSQLSVDLQLLGANAAEIALSQRFVRLYENHGELVINAQNKVFRQIGIPDNIRPQQDMKPLADLLIAHASRDEIGNLQISGQTDLEKLDALIQTNTEEIIVAAFPFGETRTKFVKYELQESSNFSYQVDFNPTNDNQDIIALDKLGRDLRIGYMGGMPQAQIFEDNNLIESLIWSEDYQLDPNSNLVWMNTEEFNKFKDNNQDQIVEVDNAGLEIIEGYDSRLAFDNFQQLRNLATQNSRKLFVNAAGNRNSYSQEMLAEIGYMPDNVLLVGGFTLIPDPLTAESNQAYASGNNIADVYIDPKDFDCESISSSEATGIMGGVVAAMIELGLAQDALSAIQIIKSSYLEKTTFYKKVDESMPISERSDQGNRLNWQKLKADLQQKLA